MTNKSGRPSKGGRPDFKEDIIENPSNPTFQQRENARRNANDHFAVREQKSAIAKQQANAESAATDAKTARLKALRLAKEEADKQAASGAGSPLKGE